MVISDIIRQVVRYYLVAPPDDLYLTVELDGTNVTEQYHSNLTKYLQSYRMKHNQTDYQSHYFYAAYSYIDAVRQLFGINQTRNHIQGLIQMQAAARFGCNEATSFLADGHRLGRYGLSRSPKLAFSYYQDVFHAWAAGTSDAASYQYNYNKNYLDMLLQDRAQEPALPKAERQHLVVSTINQYENRDVYGNIVASGILTNGLGFRSTEEMAARFAFLSACSELEVPMDERYNSMQAVLDYEEKVEKEEALSRSIEKHVRKEPQAEHNAILRLYKLARSCWRRVAAWLAPVVTGKRATQAHDEDEDTTGTFKKYKSVNIPQNLRKRLEKYVANYTIDDINLLNFNQTVPLTPDAFYDALLKLGREVTWKVYKEYGYFKIFEQLEQQVGGKPTKDQVFEHLLYSNSTLIYQAVRMFVDKTDTNAELQFLRSLNQQIDEGYQSYYNYLVANFQTYRAHRETCTRRGQAFGLLSYYINSDVLTPSVVKASNMQRNIGRIMNLGAAYYGCHMGLTGLSFLALEGYRPYKNPDINQTTLRSMNSKAKPKNSLYVRPEPLQALMGLDIASQAGSFESSYFEALLLSHKLYEFSSKQRDHGAFYYTQQFNDIGYQEVPELPVYARILAGHSAHAGHLGGMLLSGLFDFRGYGGGQKMPEAGLAKMKRAVQRITVDWQVEDHTQDTSSQYTDQDVFAQYLVYALSGDHVSLTNAFRMLGATKKFKGIICFDQRSGKQVCVSNERDQGGYRALLLELSMGFESSSVAQQVSTHCSRNVSTCYLAIFGFNDTALTKAQIELVQDYLINNGHYKQYADELALTALGSRVEKHFRAYVLQQRKRYTNLDDVAPDVYDGHLLTRNGFLQRELEHGSRFSQLVYHCFYHSGISAKKLSQVFSDCLAVRHLFLQQSGSVSRELSYLSINQTYLSEQTKTLARENQKYLNALVTDMLVRVPAANMDKLLNFLDKYVWGRYCNASEQNWADTNYTLRYEPADVVQMIANQTELRMDDVHEVVAMLNNDPQVHQIEVQLNKDEKTYGALVADITGRHELYDYCRRNLTGESSGYTPNIRIVIGLYLFAVSRRRLFVTVGIAVALIIFNDYRLRARTQQGITDVPTEPLEKYGAEEQPEEELDLERLNDDVFAGGLETEVGK